MDKIKIEFIGEQDGEYRILDIWQTYGEYFEEELFRGSLSDCEAWIRLKKEGYLD